LGANGNYRKGILDVGFRGQQSQSNGFSDCGMGNTGMNIGKKFYHSTRSLLGMRGDELDKKIHPQLSLAPNRVEKSEIQKRG